MIRLQVIECGSATSLQDAGRSGYRRFGVAMSGAMDLGALAVANARVGNRLDQGALEFAFVGGRFRVAGGDLYVAVAGPSCNLTVAGRTVPSVSGTLAVDGQEIVFGPVRQGVFGYLAVAGGFALEPELQSCSVHWRSGIGGRTLVAGDELPCVGAKHFAGGTIAAPLPLSGPIRIMAGPQEDHFLEEALGKLQSEEFKVLSISDRMGIKLDGPALRHSKGGNIISDGVLPGNIQVPGDERPVVLMRDCQTSGGYPKIATVISADLDRLAQIPPGHSVRFTAVSREEAVRAACASAQGRSSLRQRVGKQDIFLENTGLLDANLIDGVVDARPSKIAE